MIPIEKETSDPDETPEQRAKRLKQERESLAARLAESDFPWGSPDEDDE